MKLRSRIRFAIWQHLAMHCSLLIILVGALAEPCAAQSKSQQKEVMRQFNSWMAQKKVSQKQKSMPRKVVATNTRQFGKPVKHFRSAAFGYEINLTGKGWTSWQAMNADFPGGEFGAENRQHGAMMVVLPVPMPKREPKLDDLTKALLACLSLEYPGNNFTDVKPYQVGTLTGQRLRAQRTLNGVTGCYDLRVVADKHAAYLIGGWLAEESPTRKKVLKDALDRVRITTRELPEKTELRDPQQRFIALVLHDIGKSEYERGDYVAAVDFFASASSHFPDNEVIFANHLQVLGELNRSMEALLSLQQREIHRPSSIELRVLKARLLCQRSDFEAARKVFTELFAEGCTDESVLIAYLSLALEAKAYDEAIVAVNAVAKRKPTLDIQRLGAGLYALKGDFGMAIEVLQVLRSKCPTDRGLALDLARAYEQAGKHDDALDITKQMLADGADDEDTLLLHGRIQMHLGQFTDAKQTFERAQSLYPHSEAATAFISLSSGQLGQGDNSALKTPLAKVEIPPVVQQAIERATSQTATQLEGCDAEEIMRLTGLYFEPNKPLRQTLRRRIKMHTSGGVSRYNTLTIPYSPNSERVYINRLVVLDELGNQVAEGSVDNYYIVDDTSSGIASSKKKVNLPVPGLKPGYTLECTITREDLFPAGTFPYQEAILSSSLPTGVGAFFVQGDVKHLKWATSLPAEVELNGDTLYCVQANPPQFRYEANQPTPHSFISIVWIGDSTASWADEAQDYLQSIDDKIVADDQTRALALELTQECKTSREKVAAIAAHVQHGYTYQAIEFGRRGQVPNSAARTLELKYGDCKDHSVLMKQLLECAGVPAHLALMKSFGSPQRDLPSLDQFDHMVVYVPAEALNDPANSSQGLVIDATEKDADPLLTPPFGMGDKPVFVLDPAEPRFIQTPGYPEGAGELVSRRQVTLRVDDPISGTVSADVVEEVTFNAYLAPAMRALLKHTAPAERRGAIQELLAKNGQIRVKRLDVKNLEQTAEPLCLTLEYVTPDVFQPLATSTVEKSLVGRLPCPWESRYMQTEYLEARRTPFEIAIPIVIRSSLTVDSPVGFELVGLDRRIGSGQTKFVTWQCRCHETGSNVEMEYEYRLAAGSHAAEDYEQYCAAMKKSRMALQAPLTLREGVVETARRPAAGQSQ